MEQLPGLSTLRDRSWSLYRKGNRKSHIIYSLLRWRKVYQEYLTLSRNQGQGNTQVCKGKQSNCLPLRFFYAFDICLDLSGTLMVPPFAMTSSLRQFITKTYLYNFDPLKPHFYIVKLGFAGVCYFSYFCSKHGLWVLVRTASPRRF